MKPLILTLYLILVVLMLPAQPMDSASFSIVRQIFSYDKSVPVDFKETKRNNTDSIVTVHFTFTGWSGSKVPGTLAFKSKAERNPNSVYILIHGFGGSKKDWWESRTYENVTSKLLKEGYAILTLDLMYHGDRTYENNYREPFSIFESRWMNVLRDMLIHSTIEHAQIIDYFVDSNIVEPNINILGFSTGGMVTFYLNILRSDIKTSVAWAVPPDPGTYFLRTIHYANRAKSKNFIIAAGQKDRFYRKEQVEELFGLLNENKDMFWYDGGHEIKGEDFDSVLELINKRH